MHTTKFEDIYTHFVQTIFDQPYKTVLQMEIAQHRHNSYDPLQDNGSPLITSLAD